MNALDRPCPVCGVPPRVPCACLSDPPTPTALLAVIAELQRTVEVLSRMVLWSSLPFRIQKG